MGDRQPRGEGLWEREGVGQAAGLGKGAREAREQSTGEGGSYQTLSRRSNYCQRRTPRLCRLS